MAIAMGNSGLARFLPLLERWAVEEAAEGFAGTDEVRITNWEAWRKAAHWAIRRITADKPPGAVR